MFRLSKYELRKNRTALFVLLAGLAALQICFLIALRGKTQDYAIIWSTILVLSSTLVLCNRLHLFNFLYMLFTEAFCIKNSHRIFPMGVFALLFHIQF